MVYIELSKTRRALMLFSIPCFNFLMPIQQQKMLALGYDWLYIVTNCRPWENIFSQSKTKTEYYASSWYSMFIKVCYALSGFQKIKKRKMKMQLMLLLSRVVMLHQM